MCKFTELDFAPAEIYDKNFSGVVAESTYLCRIHKEPPEQCVAFEGTNTGRRFYCCPRRDVSIVLGGYLFTCLSLCSYVN